MCEYVCVCAIAFAFCLFLLLLLLLLLLFYLTVALAIAFALLSCYCYCFCSLLFCSVLLQRCFFVCSLFPNNLKPPTIYSYLQWVKSSQVLTHLHVLKGRMTNPSNTRFVFISYIYIRFKTSSPNAFSLLFACYFLYFVNTPGNQDC